MNAGNFIGIGANGTTAVANLTGILVRRGSRNNFIGTDSDGSNDAAEEM